MMPRPEVMGTTKQCWPSDCVVQSRVQIFDIADKKGVLKQTPILRRCGRK